MAFRAVAPVLILVLCFNVCHSEYSTTALSTHIDTMLAEYDREVPPAARTVVTVALDVRHASVDDNTASMKLLADLHMNWMDSRLAWNATQWEGDSMLVSAERVWTPDVQLVSAGAVPAAPAAAGGLRARVAAGGAVTRVVRLALAVPVAMQLQHWPLDTQEAVFKFASREHSLDEIDLVVKEYKGSLSMETGAWELLDATGSLMSWTRTDGQKARGASWAVRARRRGAARAAQHHAALAAAALLLMAAVGRAYTQRIPLTACATLLTAFWLMSVIYVVPAAASTPRIVVVMCGVCVACAAAGAGAVLAHAVSRRAAPPPAALRALLSKVSALYNITPEPECLSETRVGAWAAAAQLLDALLTSLVVLALLVLILVYMLA